MNKNEKMNENDVQNEKDWLKAVNVQSICRVSAIKDDDDECIEFSTRNSDYIILSQNSNRLFSTRAAFYQLIG